MPPCGKNERKARFIAAALSGDTSVRRLEDLGEGQANQFAMAKAIASGDPRLMQKAGLEAEIARFERLHAAHIDDQHAIRRQIRDAEREIEISTRRLGDIAEDVTRLVPTSGDAFTTTVKGTRFDERKFAGRALMQEILTLVQQHENDVVIASIGGFDVTFEGERIGRDGYHYVTMLQRTGAQFEIELPMTVTPLGAVARLEHPLTNFDGEQENHRRRLAEAERRLASYRERVGEAFAFAAELDLKRAELAEIEVDLANDGDRADTAGLAMTVERLLDRRCLNRLPPQRDSRFSSSIRVRRDGGESPQSQSTRLRSLSLAPGAKLLTSSARKLLPIKRRAKLCVLASPVAFI